jgi:hypothetical protein
MISSFIPTYELYNGFRKKKANNKIYFGEDPKIPRIKRT